jgi:hypothetical protein
MDLSSGGLDGSALRFHLSFFFLHLLQLVEGLQTTTNHVLSLGLEELLLFLKATDASGALEGGALGGLQLGEGDLLFAFETVGL